MKWRPQWLALIISTVFGRRFSRGSGAFTMKCPPLVYGNFEGFILKKTALFKQVACLILVNTQSIFPFWPTQVWQSRFCRRFNMSEQQFEGTAYSKTWLLCQLVPSLEITYAPLKLFNIPVGHGRILNIDESLTCISFWREGKELGVLILLIISGDLKINCCWTKIEHFAKKCPP